MARHLRIDYPGAVHHVFGRGNERKTTFRDEVDYRLFLSRLIELKDEFGFSVLTYCLMPNHYHLGLRTGNIPLSKFMMRLLTFYTRVFNDRWNRVGHLFQGRYGDRLCANDNDLRGLARYVHLNPVEAGLVAHAEDWPWSSHRAYIGEPDPIVDRDSARALFPDHAEYSAFMSVQRPRAEREPLAAIAGALGDAAFLLTIKSNGNDRRTSERRRSFVCAALDAGYRCSEVATFLGKSRSTVSRLVQRCSDEAAQVVNNQG